MSIWILRGWDTIDGQWVINKVLFNPLAVALAVREIFAECDHYDELVVECWHRDDVDDPDASFYEEEHFYREDLE